MAQDSTRIVEVIQPFKVGTYEVSPGSRVLAWRSVSCWHVIFNGADIRLPPGIVGDIDSMEVKQAAEERRSAREEEYQLAPSKPKGGAM
jgi:hypothetical protein